MLILTQRGYYMAPASKAQQKAVAKYMKANYDEIKVRTYYKGKRAEIQAHAAARDESMNEFINRAIDETIKRDDTIPK